jgi:hypothetical protein
MKKTLLNRSETNLHIQRVNCQSSQVLRNRMLCESTSLLKIKRLMSGMDAAVFLMIISRLKSNKRFHYPNQDKGETLKGVTRLASFVCKSYCYSQPVDSSNARLSVILPRAEIAIEITLWV